MKPALDFCPIDDGARAGRSVLLSDGEQLALGRWNGEAFVYPATGDMPVGIVPIAYYDPARRSDGACHHGRPHGAA